MKKFCKKCYCILIYSGKAILTFLPLLIMIDLPKGN